MVVKRITLAFNDEEYAKLIGKCSDCRPVVTPYGFIKQLVLKEIGDKKVGREKSVGDNLGETERDGQTLNKDGTAIRIIEDIDIGVYT